MVDQAHLEKHGEGGHGWTFAAPLTQDAIDEVHNKDHFRENQHRMDHAHDAEGRIDTLFHDRRE